MTRPDETTHATVEDAIAACLAEAKADGEPVTVTVHERHCASPDGEVGCTCEPKTFRYDPSEAPA